MSLASLNTDGSTKCLCLLLKGKEKKKEQFLWVCVLSGCLFKMRPLFILLCNLCNVFCEENEFWKREVPILWKSNLKFKVMWSFFSSRSSWKCNVSEGYLVLEKITTLCCGDFFFAFKTFWSLSAIRYKSLFDHCLIFIFFAEPSRGQYMANASEGKSKSLRWTGYSFAWRKIPS